jgi:hypothetical protein
MKFLRVDNGIAHRKNIHGFKLLAKAAGAELIVSGDRSCWSDTYDLVWIPVGYFHSSEFPNAKRILYGPHNFTLPQPPWTTPPSTPFTRSIYTTLSDWNDAVYRKVPIASIPTKPLPFPIDIEEYSLLEKPQTSEPEFDCVFYFKHRNHKMIDYMIDMLNDLKLKFIFFRYGSYTEEEYKNALKKVKFVYWVGCHESQGFGLEETLASNVPMLVYDVQSMYEEHNHLNQPSYMDHLDKHLHATSCTYWDDTCGVKTTDFQKIPELLQSMKQTWRTYQPRNYIVNTLSAEACWNRIRSAFDLKQEATVV